MIRQHHLQQQRLNNNHDQLLQRFQHVGPPQISEFRAFGRSQLPGRKYDQYIDTMNGNHRRRDSLVAQSRASIGGSSSDTYRLMGDGINEILPRNISSIMQHTREQPSPLVLAEKKFEPVAFYEHPVFGRTPAYVRPITDHQRSNDVIDNDSDNEEEEEEDDDEVPSRTLRVATPKIDGKDETRSTISTVKDDDNNDDDSARIPKGYISYKNWKEKYANLIPVNPLLYNIYTHRSNGSLHSYGRSLYKSPNHIRALTRDEDDSTPTISDIGSIMSDAPRETSLPSNRQYQRLQPQLFSRTNPSRPRESTPAESDDEESDGESNSSNSPVPYLPQNRTNPILSRPTIGITSSPVSSLPTPSTLNVSNNNTTGISSTPIIPISTSNIPPAPPMSSSLLSGSTSNTYQTTSTIPPAPPMPSSSLLSESTNNTYQTTSTIPPAPPMPSSLLSESTNNTYQTTSTIPPAPPMPSSLLSGSINNTYQRTSTIPPAPPIPAPLSTTSSTGIYQTTSNASFPPPALPKAVTFGGSSSFPASNNEVSSSSDSDDDDKEKRRRRKKRQAAAGLPVDSSSDD